MRADSGDSAEISPRAGLVSVVLVNFRGADDTILAIEHLGRVDWPAADLEIVVVENGSGDDSALRIAAAAPHVRIVQSEANLGFAGGCNLGVAHSRGEFVAFLNNDAKPHAGWITAAIATFTQSDRIGAVASKVLDWDGKLVDFTGAGMTWFGMGYKPWAGDRPQKDQDDARDVLFGTGSAMFVRRSVYSELGGFDERYFMFFEDVDFGWRLNLRGWRFRYAPGSIAYHKHHASMASFGSFKESYLLERNALFTLYKNFEQSSLDRALPAAMALAIRRGVAKGALDSTSFDIRRPGGDAEPEVSASKETMASVYAIDQFVENLPGLEADRAAVQSSRVVSDARLWRLFGETDAPSYQDPYYLDGYGKLAGAFDVLDSPPPTRVVIITGDPIGAKLAGPAIRAWNMAEALSGANEVTLISHTSVEQLSAPFRLVHIAPGHNRAFRLWEKWADVIIFQGHALQVFPELVDTSKVLVADIYDPMHLEQLEQARELPRNIWNDRVEHATAALNEQLAIADYFICASDRQRMFFLGQLAALGRINPANYEGDPDLTGLIDIVPFGLSRIEPVHERDVLKGVLPGIGQHDKLLLWSGGLYNWFDPKTLIRAVALLSKTRPEVRLFFQGTKHPHPGVPEMQIVAQSRDLARSLDVLDSSVFFNSSWVDYSERQNYLLEADAGVSTHHAHIETTMSFRTRILDYLWAGLPMVVSDGDVFAELIQRESLGLVVPADDHIALAVALERILFDDELITRSKVNIARVRESYFWDRVLEPLTSFVAEAAHAADRPTEARGIMPSAIVGRRQPARTSGLRHSVSRTVFYLRNGGPRVVAAKIGRRLFG